jgi:hypothetical protein
MVAELKAKRSNGKMRFIGASLMGLIAITKEIERTWLVMMVCCQFQSKSALYLFKQIKIGYR